MKHTFIRFSLFSVIFLWATLGFAATHLSLASVAAQSTDLTREAKFSCSAFDKTDDQRKAWHLADGGISERKAASIAQSAYGGSVMSVTRDGNVYKVKLLQDGRVRIVLVDAITGSIKGG